MISFDRSLSSATTGDIQVSNRAMFGHAIAAGFANNLQMIRFFYAAMAFYHFRNVYIVYDAQGLPVFGKAAKAIHDSSRSSNLISTLKPVNSSSPDSYRELLVDFQKVARGESTFAT